MRFAQLYIDAPQSIRRKTFLRMTIVAVSRQGIFHARQTSTLENVRFSEKGDGRMRAWGPRKQKRDLNLETRHRGMALSLPSFHRRREFRGWASTKQKCTTYKKCQISSRKRSMGRKAPRVRGRGMRYNAQNITQWQVLRFGRGSGFFNLNHDSRFALSSKGERHYIALLEKEKILYRRGKTCTGEKAKGMERAHRE